MNLGAGERTADRVRRAQLQGSRYADRPPIGTPESIQGARRDQLVRFYHDWYRPDLMAVIAVGDFERAPIEALPPCAASPAPPGREARLHFGFTSKRVGSRHHQLGHGSGSRQRSRWAGAACTNPRVANVRAERRPPGSAAGFRWLARHSVARSGPSRDRFGPSTEPQHGEGSFLLGEWGNKGRGDKIKHRRTGNGTI